MSKNTDFIDIKNAVEELIDGYDCHNVIDYQNCDHDDEHKLKLRPEDPHYHIKLCAYCIYEHL